MTGHYKESDFLDRLYGIGREDRHLEECGTCQAEYENWLAARKEVVSEPEVPAALLAAQRQQILERSGRTFWRWSPALVAAAMAVVAVLWNQPEKPVAMETARLSDTQVLADIYKTVYEAEPQAVAPLHGLFEDKGQSND
jgi:anti-sigma factor RsiW